MEPKSAATSDFQIRATRPDRVPKLLSVMALLLAIAGTLHPGALALEEGPFAMVVSAPHDGEGRGPSPEGIWAQRWFFAARLLAGQIGLSEWAMRLPYALIFFALGAGLLGLSRRGSEAFFVLSCLAPLIVAIGGRWIEPRLVPLAPALALALVWTRPWTLGSPAGWGFLLAAGGALWLNGLGAFAAILACLVSGLGALALRGRASRIRTHGAALVTALALVLASRLPLPLGDESIEPMDFARRSPLLFAAGILALVTAAYAAWRSHRNQGAHAAFDPSPAGDAPEQVKRRGSADAGGKRTSDLLFPLVLMLATATFLALSPIAFALPLAALPLIVARAAGPERWPHLPAPILMLGGSAVLLLCLLSAHRSVQTTEDDPVAKLKAAKALGPAQVLVLEGKERFRMLYYIHRGHGLLAQTRLIPEDWTHGEIARRFALDSDRNQFANRQQILVLLPAPKQTPRGLRALSPAPPPGGPQAFGLQ